VLGYPARLRTLPWRHRSRVARWLATGLALVLSGIGLWRRTLEGEDARRPATASSAPGHHDRLTCQPRPTIASARNALAVRATPLPSAGNSDARPPRGRFRPPPSHPKRRQPHDRRGAIALMHSAGDAYATPPDESSPERGTPLQQCRRHRGCVLRLQARPDWGRPKRDRAPPNPGLPVPLDLAAATPTAAASTSSSGHVRPVLSGRVHPSAA
jgi:hypothetical protein